MRPFNDTERYILQKRYSRQRIDYWEKRGYVPVQIIRLVSEMIGRDTSEMLPEAPPPRRRKKESDLDFPA